MLCSQTKNTRGKECRTASKIHLHQRIKRNYEHETTIGVSQTEILRSPNGHSKTHYGHAVAAVAVAVVSVPHLGIDLLQRHRSGCRVTRCVPRVAEYVVKIVAHLEDRPGDALRSEVKLDLGKVEASVDAGFVDVTNVSQSCWGHLESLEVITALGVCCIGIDGGEELYAIRCCYLIDRAALVPVIRRDSEPVTGTLGVENEGYV